MYYVSTRREEQVGKEDGGLCITPRAPLKGGLG